MSTKKIDKIAADALKKVHDRSFAQRHPELGKMIKCPVCNRRHREIVHCKLNYSVKTDSFTPRSKGRFHPHLNKRNLQLVQRTQKLYYENQPYLNDPVECMKESRKQARRELKTEFNAKRKVKQQQQKRSRRINRSK